MTRRISLAILTILGIFGLCFAHAADLTVDSGKLSGLSFSLEGLEDTAEKLGLEGSKSFKLGNMDEELVIVEIFSMYCPHCQREAPNVNKLYEKIRSNGHMDDKVELLGVGAGNTPYEVKLFAKKYSIAFPLVADPQMKIAECFDQRVRTPTFIVLKKVEKGGYEAVSSQSGGLDDLDGFLEKIEALVK